MSSAQQPQAPKKDDIVQAVETLAQNRTGIVLTGHVQNGKVVLDKDCLDEIARKHPNANIAFVAVNAPFDPESSLP
jgi:type II secretory pathway predicted ATPase ExeA